MRRRPARFPCRVDVVPGRDLRQVETVLLLKSAGCSAIIVKNSPLFAGNNLPFLAQHFVNRMSVRPLSGADPNEGGLDRRTVHSGRNTNSGRWLRVITAPGNRAKDRFGQS